MRNIFGLSIGNKIALFSLIVAIATLIFGVYQHIGNKIEDGQKINKDTSIVTGNNSAVVNGALGDITINYSFKEQR